MADLNKINMEAVKQRFALGMMDDPTVTKMEQRYRPGTVGDSKYNQSRPLSAAEREGLVPIDPQNRRVPRKHFTGNT